MQTSAYVYTHIHICKHIYNLFMFVSTFSSNKQLNNYKLHLLPKILVISFDRFNYISF